jgi:hypothetical protein
MENKSKLLLTQVPFDCCEDELQRWIEARGYEVENIKLIRDLVSGTSPSFAQVQLKDTNEVEGVAQTLSGQMLRGRTILASRAPAVRTSRAHA